MDPAQLSNSIIALTPASNCISKKHIIAWTKISNTSSEPWVFDHKNFLALEKSLDDCPSVKYVNNVHGDPEKPIIGVFLLLTFLFNLVLLKLIAFPTGAKSDLNLFQSLKVIFSPKPSFFNFGPLF